MRLITEKAEQTARQRLCNQIRPDTDCDHQGTTPGVAIINNRLWQKLSRQQESARVNNGCLVASVEAEEQAEN